ncbi:MAG: cation diffusion facilitator family transporter [Eubacteriaceae bacterium]|jgi:cation diffusion facilitator family transporter
MTSFLVRHFVKDYKDVNEPKVRQHYGSFAGTIGIICNIFLFLIKLSAGLLTSSIAIISDAFNNLSDAGSSIITLFGFHMAAQPADKEHPYGHGRVEYLTGVLISFIIILVGVLLFKTSADKIISGEATGFTILSIVILAVSVGVKLWMWKFYGKLGGTIRSVALRAASADSISDCVATSAVIICAVIEYVSGVSLDGWFGLAVSVFIVWSGISAAGDSVSPLLGNAPDDEMKQYITNIVSQVPEAHGFHHLMVHDYGPGNKMVTFDVVLNRRMTLEKAHKIITVMEDKIEHHFGCFVTIHPDPYDDEREDDGQDRQQATVLPPHEQPPEKQQDKTRKDKDSRNQPAETEKDKQ